MVPSLKCLWLLMYVVNSLVWQTLFIMREEFLMLYTFHNQLQRGLKVALENVNKQIENCRKCKLWQDAKHAVPGEGPVNAKLMLVGQNPGAEEDKTGKPFIGRAGKFLNKVLAENGIRREEVFVTNIVKHVSPGNRKPLPDEIAACAPFLEEQIKTVKPQLVVLMGKVAWQAPRVEGVMYVETYHPSAAMRFTKMRKRFLEDFSALKNHFVQ
jgi:uracil-DNA glycosylase